jgi:hypothetical protein
MATKRNQKRKTIAGSKPAAAAAKQAQQQKPQADTSAYGKLLADAKQSQAFSLRHERGANAGEPVGTTIGKRHVVAGFLNKIGVGGTASLKAALAYALARGTSHDATLYWLKEQSTVKTSKNGFGVKHPKYRIAGDKISILKLHVSTASGRKTGFMPETKKSKASK